MSLIPNVNFSASKTLFLLASQFGYDTSNTTLQLLIPNQQYLKETMTMGSVYIDDILHTRL